MASDKFVDEATVQKIVDDLQTRKSALTAKDEEIQRLQDEVARLERILDQIREYAATKRRTP